MLCVNNVLKNKCFACESERYGTNQNINIMYWFKIMTNIIVGLYIYLFISLISTVFFFVFFFCLFVFGITCFLIPFGIHVRLFHFSACTFKEMPLKCIGCTLQIVVKCLTLLTISSLLTAPLSSNSFYFFSCYCLRTVTCSFHPWVLSLLSHAALLSRGLHSSPFGCSVKWRVRLPPQISLQVNSQHVAHHLLQL